MCSSDLKIAGGSAASYVGGAGSSGHTDAFAVCHRAGDGYAMVTATGSYLDSPATTSPTTYKIQWALSYAAGTGYLNNNASGGFSSSITLLEIKQ